MKVLAARYFDGKLSAPHDVKLLFGGGRLRVVGRDVDEVLEARAVRSSVRVGDTPRWLYLPSGAACVTACLVVG